MTSDITRHMRTLCDLIDHHRLPAALIGGGLGGPEYLDVSLRHPHDLTYWAAALKTTVPADATKIRTQLDGLHLMVEVLPEVPAGGVP